MIEKQPIEDRLIIQCLATDYGIKVTALTFLPLGADMNGSVYQVTAEDLASYFVKVKWNQNLDTSVKILELLHDAGIQQIIPPVRTNKGQFISRVKDFTIMVFPFVKGEDGFNRDLSESQWIQLGKALRQVHEIAVPLSIQNKIRQESFSSKWQEIVRSFYDHIGLEGIDEIAVKLLKYMEEHILKIRQLVDRAEQLGNMLRSQTFKFVLCHSDIHGGNVLLDGKETIYIVDWDDPIMAPKERDLMFIGGGVANVWNKPHEQEFFYKGYGDTDVNATLLAYYRHERIVEDIAEYGQRLLLTSEGGEDRPEMFRQFIAMFEPEGVVDIAFKSEKS